MQITVDLIKHLPLFSKLNDEQIALSLSIFKVIEPDSPNYMIFEEGGIGDSLFLILKGKVEIQKVINAETGANKVLAILPEGALFGEMALLTGEPRSASAVLRGTNSVLLKVERDDFMKFMSTSPDIASLLLGSLVGSLSDRLRATSTEVVALYETGRIIGNSTNFNDIIAQILDRMVKDSHATAGFIMMWNHIVECFECQVGIPEMPPVKGLQIGSPLSRYFRELNLPATSEISEDFVGTSELGFQTPSVIYVPFKVYEEDPEHGYEKVRRVVGVAVLVSNKPNAFSLSQINLLRGISDQVSQAIANTKLMQENDSRRDFAQVYVSADL